MGIVVGALGYWLYRSEQAQKGLSQAQQQLSQVVPEQVKSQASSAVQTVSSRVPGLGGTGQAQPPGSSEENVLSDVDAAAEAARKEQQS
jgi:hypothetical protein